MSDRFPSLRFGLERLDQRLVRAGLAMSLFVLPANLQSVPPARIFIPEPPKSNCLPTVEPTTQAALDSNIDRSRDDRSAAEPDDKRRVTSCYGLDDPALIRGVVPTPGSEGTDHPVGGSPVNLVGAARQASSATFRPQSNRSDRDELPESILGPLGESGGTFSGLLRNQLPLGSFSSSLRH